MGRKVCFIGEYGQVGTCIKENEDCHKCDSSQTHWEWVNSEQKESIKQSSDYYNKMFEKLITIERLVCDIRGIAIVVHNLGYPKLYKSLDLKTNYIHELIRDIEKLSIDRMHEQTEETKRDIERLKQVLKRIG